MFEEVNKLRIRIHDADQKGMNYIPNVISIHPLNQLYLATEWLVAEALKDHNLTHKEWDEHPNEHQRNIDAVDDLSIRLGSRTQGYVNQLCLMEDILIYEYNRMSELLKNASSGKILFNPADYELLKQRLAAIRTFRNKVVAHTAYTYPKIDRKTGQPVDNPETIVRSILNLFPEPARITVGNSFFSGFSQWPSELPVFSIFGWQEEIKPIFQDWERLFIKKLLEVHTMRPPIKNDQFSIEAVSPHLAREFLTK